MSTRDLSAFASRTMPLRTVPDVARHVPAEAALQRIYFQTGRTLTASALELEARNFEARRGLMGRVLADGVVDGLQITLGDQTQTPGAFTLGPGYAVSPTGQDISVGRARALTLEDLPLRTPDGGQAFNVAGIGVLALSAIAAQEAAPDSISGHLSGFAWDQPRDPGSAPYVDLRFVDGVELTYFKLPSLAALATASNGINAAAQRLIDDERLGGDLTQYSKTHVGLALVAADLDGRILWMSRHGAARKGGGILPALPDVSGGLNIAPSLRKASVDSLLEQLSNWRARGADTPFPDALRHLPSAGLVSAPGGTVPPLFPEAYARSIAPIRLSEVDLLLQRSAALAPYDLSTLQDEVCWHIPVPDRYFEQELLLTPEVSPAFLSAVGTMWTRVEEALADRRDLRDQGETVENRLDSAAITQFPADTDAVAGEENRTLPSTTQVTRFDDETREVFDTWFDGLNALYVTRDQQDMVTFHSESTPAGVIPFQKALTEAVKAADDVVDFGFTRVQADIYRLRQSLLDNEEATKLATFPILAGIARGSNAMAKNLSLKEYFNSVQSEQRTVSLAIEAAAAPKEPAQAEIAFFLDTGSEETKLALQGFDAQTKSASEREVLRGSSSALALSQGKEQLGSEPILLQGGVGAKFGYKTGEELTLQLGGNAYELPDTSSESFLSDSYKDDNIYAQIFDESRQKSTQEYALTTLSDKQAGIKYASAVPGAYQDLRSVTIADRLGNPAANSARISALRVKADAFSSLHALDISLEAVRAPIFGLEAQLAVITRDQLAQVIAQIPTAEARADLDNYTNDYEALYGSGNDPVEIVFFKLFDELNARPVSAENTALIRQFERLRQRLVKGYAPIDARELPGLVLEQYLDPLPAETDESGYFTAAVAILESVVSAFRATERRIAAISGLIENTRVLIGKLQDIRSRWFEALASVDMALAEARHDLNAALALLSEEEARVSALDAQRKDVLARHARVAVFARPRRMMPHSHGVTSARILPGVFEDPLPEALATSVPLPEALEVMTDMLRHVPLDWFASHERITARLRKPRLIERAVQHAANSAAIRLNARQTTQYVAQLSVPKAGRAAFARSQAVTRQISTYYDGLSQSLLKARANTDLAKLRTQSWQMRKARALKVLSLSDLIEAGRDTKMAATAIAEIENIENVVSSLLLLLHRAPAAVRLIWADRLSRFDDTPKLARASDLPGWSALSLELRRDIQRLVQWLYQRASADRPEAKRMMGDLLHVAVLQAAHGDADAIVSARLEGNKTVGAGDTVDVILDHGKPDIGGRFDFDLGRVTGLWGTVEDLTEDRATVRIHPKFATRVTLTQTTSVFAAGYGPAKALSNVR